jgi:hypothetical protein
LESIGFQWRLKPEKVSWDERFEALKCYKEEFGHCRPPQNHPEIGSVRYSYLNLVFKADATCTYSQIIMHSLLKIVGKIPKESTTILS